MTGPPEPPPDARLAGLLRDLTGLWAGARCDWLPTEEDIAFRCAAVESYVAGLAADRARLEADAARLGTVVSSISERELELAPSGGVPSEALYTGEVVNRLLLAAVPLFGRLEAQNVILNMDRDRLDWLDLEEQQGGGLISDDGGRWAFSTSGMQNVPEDKPSDISTSFFVQAAEWQPTVREAIDAAREEAS